MKVAFLAGTLGRGGAEKQLIFMLKALLKAGVEVRVLCLTRNEAYEKEIRELDVDIDWIGSSKRKLSRLGKVIQNLRSRPADILQSSHFYTNIYAGICGRILGIPSIGAIRNDLISEISANGVFGPWHLNLPNRLIVNSALAYRRAIARGICADNIDFVRNVVSNQASAPKLNGDDIYRILFCGRLVKQKRPELFVELVSKLRNRLTDRRFKFIVAGDGPLRTSVEQLAIAKGLGPTELILLGEQADMGHVYRDSDILVLSSGYEGTPNVILEAMSHGIPVVATRVGGVPEVVGEGCGILVDPHNPEDLFWATSRLILDKQLRIRMGREAHRYVQKNHSLGYLQGKLMGIYSGMVNDEGSKN